MQYEGNDTFSFYNDNGEKMIFTGAEIERLQIEVTELLYRNGQSYDHPLRQVQDNVRDFRRAYKATKSKRGKYFH